MPKRLPATITVLVGLLCGCAAHPPGASPPPASTQSAPPEQQQQQQQQAELPPDRPSPKAQSPRHHESVTATPIPPAPPPAPRDPQALVPGKIIYNPPPSMKTGVGIPLQARIGVPEGSTEEAKQALEESLQRSLIRPAQPSQPLQVANLMKVTLAGASDEFKIEPKSDETQIVAAGAPTEWLWIVTPLKPGKHYLILSAAAILQVDGKERSRQELPSYRNEIQVQVNPVYFVTQNWKEISGAVSGSGLLGWLAAWWTKRSKAKRRRKVAA